MYGHAPAPAEPAFDDARWLAAWRELDCRLDGVQSAFEASVEQILERLTPAQQHGLWGIGRQLGKLGRGAAPVQAWLMHWPEVVTQLGDDDLNDVMHLIQVLHKSPNSAAIAPLLGTLSTAARRLGSSDGLRLYLQLIEQFTQSTTGSIHGLQQTQPSPGLLPLLNQVPQLLHWLSLAGLRRWVLHGARVHARHPQHQADYFALISPDSVAMMQRQRQGHLLVDVQRQLHLSLRALWNQDISLVPLTGDDAGAARISPGLLLDALGLPDVLQDLNGVPALTRYQLMIMHAAGHRAWSGQWVADNWSPAQRLAVEWFEDLRIDLLMLKRLPGLRKPLLALLPPVNPSDCNPVEHACLRHRLAVLSRAALDDHATDCQTVMAPWVSLLKALAKPDADVAPLALSFVARTRLPSDALPQVWFEGTLWDWRDDNRALWRFIEEGDEEDTQPNRKDSPPPELHSLPPRLYPEWDHHTQSERLDWVKVYENLHPSGDASQVDELIQRHSDLTRRLKRVLDRLKPQGRERLRRLEHGSELDLDLAQQALMDLRSGQTPDERVHQHWRHNHRDVSVQLLMDLSASLAETVPNGHQTVLEVSLAAVAILGWTLDQLGDELAIGGFQSNSRQEVRYWHLKGFSESWGPAVKARLAAITPAYSTRLGAALRHGSRPLVQRPSPRKLFMVLTDGEPSDVDVSDPDHLAHDARQAVLNLQSQGVLVWCIQLHPAHETRVRQVFGEHYTLIDRLDQLPQTLASLFLRLTG